MIVCLCLATLKFELDDDGPVTAAGGGHSAVVLLRKGTPSMFTRIFPSGSDVTSSLCHFTFEIPSVLF